MVMANASDIPAKNAPTNFSPVQSTAAGAAIVSVVMEFLSV
jgi:hypothetical protein